MRLSIVSAALMGLAAGVFGGAAAPPLGTVRPVKIVEVYDGDTVVVEFQPQRARVRLLNCWTPEVRATDAREKAKGIKARDYLRSIAEGRDAVLYVPYQQDIGKETTLGRVLGSVYVDGEDVSELMVKSGHATRDKP